MNKIIIAFSGDPHSTAALRWAAELAGLTKTPLEVVNVFNVAYAEHSTAWYDEMIEARRDEVEAILHDCLAGGADLVMLDGDEPIKVLADHLDEQPCWLGVIGATGSHAGFGAGRPAHTLLHHTKAPIAVIHPEHQPIAGGVLTVGVDGSGPNAVALQWAEEFAAATASTLHAVFAYNPMDDTFTHPEGWHRHSDDVRNLVDKVTSVPLELYMEAGHPAEVLINHARRERSSTIVTGTRGHGGFSGLVLGRVPSQLIAHATCPLIIVPH